MIYVPKTEQDAITFVDNYIAGCWLDQGNGTFRYQNLTYAGVKNPADIFRGFFVTEQNETCCYCCKSIINDHTTELEHIIPRTEDDPEEFEKYYLLSGQLRNNVVRHSTFIASNMQQLTPPHPHHVAYHNIVASCNGRTFATSNDFTCCNRSRGNVFLPPFNLMENSIEYFPDGMIVYKDAPLDRAPFDVLNLNKDILVNIRRLWYLFSRSELPIIDILEYDIAGLEQLIDTHALVHSTTLLIDNKLKGTFSKPVFWDLFKKYAYFGTYYRAI